MRPQNPETLKTLLQEGIDDAHHRQLKGDADEVFAGRMSMRLIWALERIRQLEAEAVNRSWEGDVDRQGGSFSDDEVVRSLRERW
jgi:hypothetical protein